MLKDKRHFKFSLIYTFCFLVSLNFAYARSDRPVSGIVVSNKSLEPINGVTISIENKGVGSITNEEGKFVIVLHDPIIKTDSITFSSIGYMSKRVSIDSALSTQYLLIKLSESVTGLKEVTIKPLSLKQLLDSVIDHNNRLFVSPVKLKGYYREFVYTNAKCTEYSDALCEYYFNRSTFPDGQLKINASRCLEAPKVNDDRHNATAYNESVINPNSAFRYAMLAAMVVKYLPDKNLPKYKYNIEQTAGPHSDDLIITILPKPGADDEFYKLTLILKDDYTLISYHLEIPESLLAQVKEKSLLGIHVKVTQFDIRVNYSAISGRIYPGYYIITKTYYVKGKILGASFDQTVDNKSEYLATEVNDDKGIKEFEKRSAYKKGNICDNGVAINDALLKNYTIIKPTQKDSISIKSIN